MYNRRLSSCNASWGAGGRLQGNELDGEADGRDPELGLQRVADLDVDGDVLPDNADIVLLML